MRSRPSSPDRRPWWAGAAWLLASSALVASAQAGSARLPATLPGTAPASEAAESAGGQDLSVAVADFERDLAAARRILGPGEALDIEPFWLRMEALVERGHGSGRLWLLENLPARRLPPGAQRVLTLELLEALLGAGGLSPAELERCLMLLADSVVGLPRARADGWALVGLADGQPDRVRAAALLALAEAALSDPARGEPAALAEADQLLVKLLVAYPQSPAAERGRRRLCDVLIRRYEGDRERWWQRWSRSEEPPDPAQHPARAWWPRFEGLAQEGVGPARWWLAVHAERSDGTPAEQRLVCERCLAEILSNHAHDDWLVVAIQESARLVDTLSFASVSELLESLAERSDNPEVRAWALFSLANLLGARPDQRQRALSTYERLQRELPEHRLARSVSPRIFALSHLQLGQQPPDIEFGSLDGGSQRLSDYRSRPLAIVFWSSWSGEPEPSAALIDGLRGALDEGRFRLLCVNLDEDVAGAQALVRSEGLAGEHLFLGEPNAAWPRTWDLRSFPALFVLDAKGRIAGRDLGAEQAAALLESLLAPARASGALAPRAPIQPAPPAPRPGLQGSPGQRDRD
jgi:hypothetical protein